jgi:hypothetical protein
MTYIDSDSGKRYHRKGFKGHKVNPSGQGKKPRPKAFFPAAMSNHDKMIWRADQRKAKLAK